MAERLVICDLDNTLYDWVGYFVGAFYSMVDEVVRITQCDREQLLDDFRIVHRRHHDSEHPFSLLETDTILSLYPNLSRKQMFEKLSPAFHAFNSSRKNNLRLYPGVKETLETLSSSNIPIVAHTESKLFAVVDRITRLDLSTYFTRIYCRKRPRTTHPDSAVARTWLDEFPMRKVVELSHHQRKPDPDVLLEICRREGAPPENCVYVGDSIARDVLMARLAGACAVWAKYGASHARHEYEKLVRVTHWTADDVTRERALAKAAQSIRPDYVLTETFIELLDVALPAGKKLAVGPRPNLRLSVG